MNILLTGGTGFFGRALLQHWVANESAGQPAPNVTLLSRDPTAFASRYPALANQSWLRLVVGDVCDPSGLPRDTAFTHILHAATDSTLGPQMAPLQRYDQIVNGTRNMLDLAVACGAERFLLTSSGAVYGEQPFDLEKIPEDWNGLPDPLRPANAYGVAKRAAEHLCALYGQAHGLHTVVARCFAFVGPDLPLDVHFAIGNFIRDAVWRDSITIGGDGTPMRSYLDQRDLAHWLSSLLTRGQSGQAYNVGSDEAISMAELAYLVRDTLAPSKAVHILGALGQRQQRNIYIPDITKARNELQLGVRVTLQDAIAHTGQVVRAQTPAP
jgi:UDP-glucuronate decarboxylase